MSDFNFYAFLDFSIKQNSKKLNQIVRFTFYRLKDNVIKTTINEN